jgi:hypothetical protein
MLDSGVSYRVSVTLLFIALSLVACASDAPEPTASAPSLAEQTATTLTLLEPIVTALPLPDLGPAPDFTN